jgi:hypothetical protein
MAPGDELLFRPLLFGMLCLKQAVFGHQLWWHQFISLAAYSMTCSVFFFACCSCQGLGLPKKGSGWETCSILWVSLTGSLFVALNSFNYELAAWSHISGYPVAYGLIFLALALLLRFLQDDAGVESSPPITPILLIAVLLMLASFFYEIALPVAFGFAAICFGKRLFEWKKGRATLEALFLVSVIAIYQAANLIDKSVHATGRGADPISNLKLLAESGDFSHSLTVLKFILVQPFSAQVQNIQTFPLGRTVIDHSTIPLLSFWAFAIIILFVSLNFVYLFVKPRLSRSSIFLLLFGLLSIMPTLLIVRVATHPNGLDYMFMSPYYAFLPISMLVLLSLPLRHEILQKQSVVWRLVLGLLYLILSLPNALAIYRCAKQTAQQVKPLYEAVASLDQQISQLALTQASIGFVTEGIFAIYGVPITTALWGRYENPESPDYVFDLSRQTEAIAWDRRRKLSGVPKFQKAGNTAHLWSYEGQFFWIPHTQSYPKPFADFVPGEGSPIKDNAIAP